VKIDIAIPEVDKGSVVDLTVLAPFVLSENSGDIWGWYSREGDSIEGSQ